MKNYKVPEMDVVKFASEDILTLSGTVKIKIVEAGGADEISFTNGDAGIDFQNQ